jgi:hypothetical protein
MPRQRSQGLHVDPQALPEPHPSTWNADQQDAWAGAEMAVLRAALALDGAGVRDSVLGELAEYHGQTIEEAYGRCIHWEQSSIEEWKAGDRSTPQGVRDFYETVASWRYDLAWYGYLQATGHAFPQSVALVRLPLIYA